MTLAAAAEDLEETREAAASPAYDLDRVRADFPILAQKVHGRPLVYLDNAASTQKPRAVMDAIAACYGEYYANVERGVHTLSQRSTAARERAREAVRRFLNAASTEEVVFVRGTTEAINLVAASWGRRHVGAGDEVLITELEHHSNIVPWQLLCEERGALLRVAPIDDRGEVILPELERLLSPRTRLVAVAHVSNALGTLLPVRAIAERAHAVGAVVLVDGAQAVPHLPVDVQALGVDFYAFSGHKVYGPSGIGTLWGRRELLEAMPPWQGGGGMIRTVSFARTTYAPPPHRFEAGTPAIEAAIGLGAALDYLAALGLPAVAAWEAGLLALATERLAAVPGLRLIGTVKEKAAVLSFTLEGIHPHDVGTVLDREGIAVRAGHHCAQPVMERFGVPATTRASFGLYNTREEVEALAAALHRARELFG
ncbi:MAG TPA: cysteine desulfurase [Thermoanaerobaculia bacterium]|nr:cysteine desulfurase [Thermoanaerobaculia bacterium]